jgi:LacI family transcriptional regulator
MIKRATATDVARHAGVSQTTVSLVLNNTPGSRISDATRRRVWNAVHQLNYYPNASAQRMVAGRTHLIGLVLRQTSDQAFADRFLPQVLNGLSQAADQHGYRILLAPLPPEDKTEALTRLAREHQADGLVLAGPRADDKELEQLYREGVPLVLIGQVPELDVPYVDVDHIASARLAMEHLIQLGHQRIAMITRAPLTYTASRNRLAGYRQALEAAGLRFDKRLIRYGDFTSASGQSAMDDVLQIPKPPTAVFVASDTVALGALKAIRQRGLRVPHDLALVGFDDIPTAEFVDPPLTTIRLPAYDLGAKAADLLIRLMEADKPVRNRKILLPTELIVRESCGSTWQRTHATE